MSILLFPVLRRHLHFLTMLQPLMGSGDTIQKLVEYAKGQGSSHAEMLYMTYSRLANKMAGINKRDEATVMQLNNLSLMENIILHEVDLGIMKGKHYKEIYKDCKERLETVKDLAYLEAV